MNPQPQPDAVLKGNNHGNVRNHTSDSTWNPSWPPRIVSASKRSWQYHDSEISDRRGRHCDTGSDEEDGPSLQHLIEAPPSKFKMPQLQTYDATIDLQGYIQTYRTIMGIQGADDSFLCRAFPTTPTKVAQDWYNNLQSKADSSACSANFLEDYVNNS